MLSAVLLSPLAGATDPPCYITELRGGHKVAVYQGDRSCIEFDAPRTFEGVWVNEFEGSQYFDGARNLPEARRMTDDVWFSSDRQTVWPASAEWEYGRAYKVIFEGRMARKTRTEPMGGYGHFGMFSGLVLADRVIGVEDLGPLRR